MAKGQERLRAGLEAKSVEAFLIEKLNAKYAMRIFQKINTEWENLVIRGQAEPGVTEYEWMVKRALEIHRGIIGGDKEVTGEEKAEDQIPVSGGQ